jgi:hypothetical protein
VSEVPCGALGMSNLPRRSTRKSCAPLGSAVLSAAEAAGLLSFSCAAWLSTIWPPGTIAVRRAATSTTGPMYAVRRVSASRTVLTAPTCTPILTRGPLYSRLKSERQPADVAGQRL